MLFFTFIACNPNIFHIFSLAILVIFITFAGNIQNSNQKWAIMTEKDYYRMLGEEISRLRSSRSINQEQLAEFLNISRPSVGNIENGRQKPSIYLLQLLASYFEIDMNDLLPAIPKRANNIRIIGELSESESISELYELI